MVIDSSEGSGKEESTAPLPRQSLADEAVAMDIVSDSDEGGASDPNQVALVSHWSSVLADAEAFVPDGSYEAEIQAETRQETGPDKVADTPEQASASSMQIPAANRTPDQDQEINFEELFPTGRSEYKKAIVKDALPHLYTLLQDPAERLTDPRTLVGKCLDRCIHKFRAAFFLGNAVPRIPYSCIIFTHCRYTLQANDVDGNDQKVALYEI